MTPTRRGRLHCIRTLAACASIDDLVIAWQTLAKVYQEDAQVTAVKNALKQTLGANQ